MRRVRIGTALVVALASLVIVASSVAATVDMTTSKTVAPRESCGGFNGHVRYGSILYESLGTKVTQRIVQIWGLVWDTCSHNAGSSTTSVQLSYNDCWFFTCGHTYQVGSAHAGTTSGVNQTYRTLANAGHIAVTVCSNYGGRKQCGSPAPV
jgi:hypothetical protein